MAWPTKVESLSTCLALIEIVNSCNLSCPTCYADSPQSRSLSMLSHWAICGAKDQERD